MRLGEMVPRGRMVPSLVIHLNIDVNLGFYGKVNLY